MRSRMWGVSGSSGGGNAGRRSKLSGNFVDWVSSLFFLYKTSAMSRNSNHIAPKLPKVLLDRIQGSDSGNGKRNAPSRKEKRKQERLQKKSSRAQPKPKYTRRAVAAREEIEESDEEDDVSSPPPVSRKTTEEEPPALKSILKKQTAEKPTKATKQRPSSESPPPVPRPSRGQRDKLAQDDAEIAALEKKLGMKKGKKSKVSDEDGLDSLLDGIGEAVGLNGKSGKRKLDEDEEWLRQKRRRVGTTVEKDGESDSEDDDEEGLSFDEEDEELSGSDLGVDSEEDPEDDLSLEGDDTDEAGDGEDDNEDFGGFDSDEEEEEEEEEAASVRVRENPYVAPTTGDQVPAAKYVPPSLRGASTSDAESMQRLRRQVQGLLNRLSEANLLSILQSVEQLYQNNARQHVTTIIIDLLVGMLCDKSSLMDTFLILHAGFIAAIYKVIGTDFGAQVVERIVADFDTFSGQETAGKQTSNLISLLAELYNFQVFGAAIVFDYIRLFIQDLSEDSTELLLRIIRNSGHQLRQDDPSALKDIVVQIQKSVAKVGESNLSVRMKFMIETINNLKNNRMKTGVAASAVVTEHTTRMKKILGSLNTRSNRASEPLRITLADIKNSEKKGKWWLVGASYHDPAKLAGNDGTISKEQRTERIKATQSADDTTADLLTLASEQRMNTDIRRAVFITIMSASDYKDANMRLLKLNLKKTQELEIPRVLIHCAAAEAGYNPYYTLIARKLCGDKKLRMAFQFTLWDLFRKMGERDDEADSDDDEDEDQAMNTRKVLNLAKMFAALISGGGLSITVLKNLNFAYLQPKTRMFLEIMLTTVIVGEPQPTQGQLSPSEIFSRAHDVPEMVQGLRYFVEMVIAKSDVVGKGQRKALSVGCKKVFDVLTNPVVAV